MISSTNLLTEALLMLFPLVVSGVLHMVVVKLDALSYLKIPVHVTSFGANKTWRGFIVMPAFTVAGAFGATHWARALAPELFAEHSFILLGLALGLAYALAELPNSFIKRRLGIQPGEPSARWPWLFAVMDQADSVVGCLLCYAALGIGSGHHWFLLLILGTGVHLFLNVVLWALGLRRQPL